jgi:hypothetical protein
MAEPLLTHEEIYTPEVNTALARHQARLADVQAGRRKDRPVEMPWYCDTSRDHRHSTQWEAEACTQLYELWQEAMGYLMAYVRADEVEDAVNQALMDTCGDDAEEG